MIFLGGLHTNENLIDTDSPGYEFVGNDSNRTDHYYFGQINYQNCDVTIGDLKKDILFIKCLLELL